MKKTKKAARVAEYEERSTLMRLGILIQEEIFSNDQSAALLTARKLVRLLEAIEEDN